MSLSVPDDGGAFLGSRTRLRPEHAAAALIQLSDDRYVMQLRDSKPEIFYPGHWGCFGGALEVGESAGQALARELSEELGIRLEEGECRYFTEFTFDFSFAGHGRLSRHYFTVRLPQSTPDGLVLNEGAAIDAFTAEEALGRLRLVPYDAFAIWMHYQRGRMAAEGGVSEGGAVPA